MMRYTLLVGVLCGLSIAHGVNEGVKYAAPVTHITATAAFDDWWWRLWRPILRTKRVIGSTENSQSVSTKKALYSEGDM